MMTFIFPTEQISNSWTEANILISKEDRNYCLISLLNNDCKLFTRVLAERMKMVLLDFIHEDHCGFLPKK